MERRRPVRELSNLEELLPEKRYRRDDDNELMEINEDLSSEMMIDNDADNELITQDFDPITTVDVMDERHTQKNTATSSKDTPTIILSEQQIKRIIESW